MGSNAKMPTLAKSRKQVLAAFDKSPQWTRRELADLLGLTTATVSAAIRDLEEMKLIETVLQKSHSNQVGAGRPSTYYQRRLPGGILGAVTLGRSQMRVGVASSDETLLETMTVRVRADRNAEAITALAIEKLRELQERWVESHGPLRSIGIGLPGPIAKDTDVVVGKTILPIWYDFDIRTVLGSEFSVPTVLNNDASLGLLGEATAGAAQGIKNALYVKASTGIGVGILIDGHPYAGSTGTAGELGHTSIDREGLVCKCGGRGCLETVASLPSILQSLAPALGKMPDAMTLFREVHLGNRSVIRAVHDAGKSIGYALATMCNTLNPEMIILGGQLIQTGKIFSRAVESSLRANTISPNSETVVVTAAKLEDLSEVYGAVHRAREIYEQHVNSANF